MPNPWDVGSRGCSRRAASKRLARRRRLAWSLGRLDQNVARRARRPRRGPLRRDLPAAERRQRALLPGGTRAGLPPRLGCSPKPARPAARSRTTTRRRAGSTVSRKRPSESRSPRPRPATCRAARPHRSGENHLHGVDDLEDTIARLRAYRDAGADVVYAGGLSQLDAISAVVEAVGVPMNVLALPHGRACRARLGRRAAGLHRRLAGAVGVRRAPRRRG